MSPSTAATLLEGIHSLLALEDDIEITLEANPGTFELRKFKDFRKAGINRLSIGVQSFEDNYLKFLGRIHTSEEAQRALSAASEIFDNFNVDLMFGLPCQTEKQVIEEWNTANKFQPSQISYYQLTIEEGTVFGSHPPENLPDSDSCASLQQAINHKAIESGFDHYEISGYAKSGRQCKHNLNYWEFGDYLGVGPAAHGKLTTAHCVFRTESFSTPESWLENMPNRDGFKRRAEVPREELPLEFMMNALRLRAGVPKEYFEERTGHPLSDIEDTWSNLLQQGLVYPLDTRIQTTDRGRQFLNDVLEAFID